MVAGFTYRTGATELLSSTSLEISNKRTSIAWGKKRYYFTHICYQVTFCIRLCVKLVKQLKTKVCSSLIAGKILKCLHTTNSSHSKGIPLPSPPPSCCPKKSAYSCVMKGFRDRPSSPAFPTFTGLSKSKRSPTGSPQRPSWSTISLHHAVANHMLPRKPCRHGTEAAAHAPLITQPICIQPNTTTGHGGAIQPCCLIATSKKLSKKFLQQRRPVDITTSHANEFHMLIMC